MNGYKIRIFDVISRPHTVRFLYLIIAVMNNVFAYTPLRYDFLQNLLRI